MVALRMAAWNCRNNSLTIMPVSLKDSKNHKGPKKSEKSSGKNRQQAPLFLFLDILEKMGYNPTFVKRIQLAIINKVRFLLCQLSTVQPHVSNTSQRSPCLGLYNVYFTTKYLLHFINLNLIKYKGLNYQVSSSRCNTGDLYCTNKII